MKSPRKDIRSIKLHHDNALPHTSLFTTQAIANTDWSVLRHPHYSSVLVPSDLYLFGPIKDNIRGFRFNDLNYIETALKSWVKK